MLRISAYLFLTVLTLTLLTSCEGVVKGRSVTYKKNNLSFQLVEIPGWTSLDCLDIPWCKAKTTQPNPETGVVPDTVPGGVIRFFFRDSLNISPSKSGIRIEYFSDKLPNCSSTDSVVDGMITYFRDQYAGLTINQNPKYIETVGGKKARCLEIISTINAMYMSWGYIHREKEGYIIGFNLTARTENDYKIMKPRFDELLASYRD